MTDVPNPSQNPPAPAPTSLKPIAKILAVTSGKGGVGKTFVSANLAGDGVIP
jgi:flagellar biosynthesis protein FlhG